MGKIHKWERSEWLPHKDRTYSQVEYTSQNIMRPSISLVAVGAFFQILHSRIKLTTTNSDNSKCLKIHNHGKATLPVYLERSGVLLQVIILGTEEFNHCAVNVNKGQKESHSFSGRMMLLMDILYCQDVKAQNWEYEPVFNVRPVKLRNYNLCSFLHQSHIFGCLLSVR